MNEKVVPRTLSGFMELMPQDQIMFEKIKRVIEDVYSSYGFYPLDTPIIELSEVLLAKAGGETEKQIYRFNKGDTDLSLRFDLTVPLAKYVASKYNDLVFPFKRYQIGKVFRGERAQKGRFREFYQCDIDVIGNERLSLLYDAEMPCVIYDIFKRLDIGDFEIRINNRKLLTGFFEFLGLENKITDIFRIIDKLEKIGLENTIKELKNFELTDNQIKSIINLITISGTVKQKIDALEKMSINNANFQDGLKELEFVVKNLKLMKVNDDNYTIDLTIARGLDYYTGTVYETFLKKYPSIGSICSGGRYDNLALFYTDKKLPGVGISIGLTRLFYQLKEANILTEENSVVSDIMVLPMTENYEYVYNFVNILRENNIKIDVVHLDKFKQLMKYADKQNVPYVIVIGDNEIEKGIAILKDMKTGEQIEITPNNILDMYESIKVKRNN